jgi:hypothetical protein
MGRESGTVVRMCRRFAKNSPRCRVAGELLRGVNAMVGSDVGGQPGARE